MKKISLILLPILAILFLACETTPVDDIMNPDNYFSKTVLPIFAANCVQCHSVLSPAGGLNLTSHTSIMSGTSTHGPVIIPNFADSSYLIKKLNGDEGSRMPLNSDTLSTPELTIIKIWINSGAENE